MDKTNLGYALDLAELGLSVFPIKSKGKIPRIKWEKYQKERASKEQIEKWWTKWPNANIGVATGLISNIIVIDLDSITGQDIYTGLFGELHNTISQTTGKPNGLQLLFKHPQDHIYKNHVGLYQDVDVRADGGYVVVAPSIHPNGTQYKWNIDPTEMGLNDLMDLPDAVKAILEKAQDTLKGVSKNKEGWIQEALMGVDEGSRNEICTKLAGYYLRIFGGDVSQTEIILENWNERNNPPMDWKEVRKTIASVAEREGREELGKMVGGRIEKIQIIKYPPPDNSRAYRVFLAGCDEAVEMNAHELIIFSSFKIKFCELADRVPKPVKQGLWEIMVNKALAEAEIINITIDETLTGLILKLLNAEIYSAGCTDDFEFLSSRTVVHENIIYVRLETLLNLALIEKEKVTRKDLGKILRSLGFSNELRRVSGTAYRCWFRPLDKEWHDNYGSS